MARRRRAPGPNSAGGYQGQGDPGGGQAPTVGTGRQYGAAQAGIAAQQAMPIPQVASPLAGAPAAAGPVGAPSPAPAGPGGALAAAMQQAQQMAPPQGGLLAPSARPSEPVTAGLPVGAGPGPEALGGMPAPAPTGPDPDVLLYRRWMPALELLANSPTATSQTRQFYRRLRSQMPTAAADQIGAAAAAQGVTPPPGG